MLQSLYIYNNPTFVNIVKCLQIHFLLKDLDNWFSEISASKLSTLATNACLSKIQCVGREPKLKRMKEDYFVIYIL